MSSANLGYLFYVDYYKDIDFKDIKDNKDKIIKKSERIENSSLETLETLGNSFIHLTTTYPGLLIGSGYNHEIGVVGEFKIGFYFDHTTGLPIIPGSSVKGVLRSKFPGRSEKYRKEKTEYIKSIIGNDIDVEALEKEMFESGDNIYYDAFPVAKNGNLMGEDFITPHNEILKNPIPLKFLKVMPSVKFQFDFKLSEKVVSKDEKLRLISELLLDFGVGAKINLGYGQFDRIKYEADRKKNQDKIKDETRRREKEYKKLQEKEKNDKFNALSPAGKLMSNIENNIKDPLSDAADLLKNIDNYSKAEKIEVAGFLKRFYKSNNKWDLDILKTEMKAKPFKKLEDKVNKIKNILGE